MLETRLWSTAQAAKSDNPVDFWRNAICEAIFELEFEASAVALDAQLRQYAFGALKMSDVSISTAHQVVRSQAAVRRSKEAPRFNLNYIRRGRWTVDHYGREIDLGTGELVLLDNRQPYKVEAAAGTEHVCVHLPIGWLRCWIPNPEDAVARPIRVGAPFRSALVSYIDDAPLIAEGHLGQDDLCAEQIAGALALALGPTRTKNTSHTRLIYLRIQRAMGEMFYDHSLDASAVAAALVISPRYLHKILAREGTTYSRELIRIRLDRARSMLSDGRFDELSVSEVGWRCGFCDPSHFSRRFKADAGVSPGAFRMSVRLPSTDAAGQGNCARSNNVTQAAL